MITSIQLDTNKVLKITLKCRMKVRMESALLFSKIAQKKERGKKDYIDKNVPV